MGSRPPLLLLRCFASIVVVLLLSPATEGAPRRGSEKPATIYVIRGGGGYFPNLGTVINEKFEEKGLDVVDFRYHERRSAAKQIAQAYREKKLPHGIILIGYSLGGCGVIEVSRMLQQEEIPVRLLFLIETINPLQTVPANVVECFNLYHFPAILGAPVRADSKETKLTNFEAYTDGGLGLEYSHFAMPFVDEVHDLIAARLLEAIRSKPKSLPVASGTSEETEKKRPGLFAKREEREVPASAEKDEKKPGLFAKREEREVPASAEKDEKKPGFFGRREEREVPASAEKDEKKPGFFGRRSETADAKPSSSPAAGASSSR